MNVHLILTLITLVGVILLFLCGKFKFGWVGMAAATFLCLTGVLDFKEAYGNFSSTNVIMCGSMFILAGALGKTSMVDKIRSWILNRKGNGQSVVFMYLLGALLLTQLVSPLGVIAMLLPMMEALDEKSPVQPANLLYPGAVVSHASQSMLPIGMGLTYFISANALLEANGATQRVTIYDKCMVVFIPALCVFLYMAFIGWKHFPKTTIDTSQIKEAKSGAKCTPMQEKIIYAVFILTMVCIVFNSYLPVSMYIYGIIADLILFGLNVIDLKDVKNSLNLDAIFMLAGVLCLATAMQKTGAADVVADTIVRILGGNPTPIAIMVAFYVVGAVLTQLMSNTATYQVLVPLAIITCVARGIDPRGVILAISCGTTGAMLTPMSSPSIAIAFSAGNYKMKDTFLACLPIWFIYGVVVLIMANIVYPVA